MSGRRLTADEVLAALPQQEPFRFVDEILEIDEEHIVGSYRFRPEADFYRGHFPGNPVTPGVILIESMEAANEILPEDQELVVYKNNSDGKGNSYGCHEHYLIDRATPFGRSVTHCTTHFVTRQIYTGATPREYVPVEKR